MFAVAGSVPQIKRLYIYDWTGGDRATRFDAGLTTPTTSRAPAMWSSARHFTPPNAT